MSHNENVFFFMIEGLEEIYAENYFGIFLTRTAGWQVSLH